MKIYCSRCFYYSIALIYLSQNDVALYFVYINYSVIIALVEWYSEFK